MSGPASVVLRRLIEAPVAIVYEMLSDPTELLAWLGPRNFTATEVIADVRVGGAFRFRMKDADGGEYGVKGEYREVVPNVRIVLTWAWTNAPDTEERLDQTPSLVTFELAEADGRPDATWLTLTHSQLPDEELAKSHSEGWTEALDKLSARGKEKRKGAKS